MPPNQQDIRITIPNGTSYETFQTVDHLGWDGKRENDCKRFGQIWVKEERSAILIFLDSGAGRLHYPDHSRAPRYGRDHG